MLIDVIIDIYMYITKTKNLNYILNPKSNSVWYYSVTKGTKKSSASKVSAHNVTHLRPRK